MKSKPRPRIVFGGSRICELCNGSGYQCSIKQFHVAHGFKFECDGNCLDIYEDAHQRCTNCLGEGLTGLLYEGVFGEASI